jgi:DNA-binding transcriptional LysR family regulator
MRASARLVCNGARMHWDSLEVFAAVARTGSLQGASRVLGVDRTTVGRRLAALEASLGAPLVTRRREGLALTSAGQRALAHAETMSAAARAFLSAAAPEDDVTGVVRLAVTEAMAPFVVEQGLVALTERYPRLTLELHGGNRRLDLATGEADLALRVDPLRGAELRARCISRSSVALYASRGYLSGRSVKTPAHLVGHRALVPGGELAMLPEARWLRAQAGLVPALVSNSLPALLSAARRGQGVVALTSAWGDREDELVRLFDVPGVPLRALWLVSTRAGARRPAVRVVADALVSFFANAGAAP